MKNPWMKPARPGWGVLEVQVCDADSRRHAIKSIDDPEKLKAIILWPGTQTTVRAAAQARLRKLEKLASRTPNPESRS